MEHVLVEDFHANVGVQNRGDGSEGEPDDVRAEGECLGRSTSPSRALGRGVDDLAGGDGEDEEAGVHEHAGAVPELLAGLGRTGEPEDVGHALYGSSASDAVQTWARSDSR